MLEEDRVALDRVAVKLEKELREAMNTAGRFSLFLFSRSSRSCMPILLLALPCASTDHLYRLHRE